MSGYAGVVQSYIRARYLPLRFAEELLARHARATPRAARGWLRGECAPNGENLINLMAENVELTDAILAEVARRKTP